MGINGSLGLGLFQMIPFLPFWERSPLFSSYYYPPPFSFFLKYHTFHFLLQSHSYCILAISRALDALPILSRRVCPFNGGIPVVDVPLCIQLLHSSWTCNGSNNGFVVWEVGQPAACPSADARF